MAIISIGSSSSNPKSTTLYVPLIIFTGESNAAGFALNTDATVLELSARSQVQILNNTSLLFEDLHIGVNNNIDVAGGIDNTEHGWELELANRVAAGDFVFSQVYLVKTGQGGSRITDWGESSTFWAKFKSRVAAAITIIKAAGNIPLIFVWYSQGLNDIVGSVSANTWKTATTTHLQKIRRLLGYVPILMTKFMYGRNSYDDVIDQIDTSDDFTYGIFTGDATLKAGDSLHWGYTGMKTISDRMCDYCISQIGVNEKYIQTQNYLLSHRGVTDIIDNETAVTFTAYTQSPTGIWTSSGAVNDVAGLKIPSGVNGEYRARVSLGSLTGNVFILGLDSNNTVEGYTGLEYALYPNGSLYSCITSGSFSTSGNADAGDYFKLKTSNVASVLTITAEVSHDNQVTWSILHTFPTTTYKDLWLKAVATGACSLNYPIGVNVTT